MVRLVLYFTQLTQQTEPAFCQSVTTKMSEKGNKVAAAGIPKYMKFTIGGLAG